VTVDKRPRLWVMTGHSERLSSPPRCGCWPGASRRMVWLQYQFHEDVLGLEV
jgi:hypothetical protein